MSRAADTEELAAKLGITGLRWSLVIEGNPGPKQRPRLGRGGHVYKPDAAEEAAVAWQIRAARPHCHTGRVAVGAIFYRKSRHRVDSDNLLKRLWDAGTAAGLWVDDSAIAVHYAEVRYDPAHPRTVLVVAELDTTVVSADRHLRDNDTNISTTAAPASSFRQEC